MTNKTTIIPINNHVLFKFVDEVDSKGRFIEKSSVLEVVHGDFDGSASRPRMGIVVAAGPAADPEVAQPGTKIVIENLKWTIGFKVDNELLWRTDDSCILGVVDD
jgi:hypothetical protein